MLVLNALDLWSFILYGITNISHYRHWNSVILPYISSYFITSEFIRPSNTNTRNNDPIQNNNNDNNNDDDDDNNNNDNNNNNNNDNNNNDFNNNISKYYCKIRKNDIFVFTI